MYFRDIKQINLEFVQLNLQKRKWSLIKTVNLNLNVAAVLLRIEKCIRFILVSRAWKPKITLLFIEFFVLSDSMLNIIQVSENCYIKLK